MLPVPQILCVPIRYHSINTITYVRLEIYGRNRYDIGVISQVMSGCGEMVDALVSETSAARRGGSNPLIRTKN